MKAVKDLIRQGASMAEVDRGLHSGVIPYRVWEQYHKLWTWASFRWTGTEALAQEAFERSHGHIASWRRIDRVIRLVRNILFEEVRPWKD